MLYNNSYHLQSLFTYNDIIDLPGKKFLFYSEIMVFLAENLLEFFGAKKVNLDHSTHIYLSCSSRMAYTRFVNFIIQ
jgi:hypothetical protein